MTITPTLPNQLPLQNLSLDRLSPLLKKAHLVLKLFDEVISRVEHPEVIFSLLTTQEALASFESKSKAPSLERFLYDKALEQPHFTKLLDYETELKGITYNIPKTTISSSFLRKIHRKIQKEGIPEEIGHFRTRQNWIGP